ncbi:hypothetical protein FQN55_007370 [Onygenales sp. PD_40]|nr:hypothetical protein FQN55_007370 [Onygenales sp. PD_40]KAK2788486.1 hypothetical protein FQN53_003632 [Emmonsiellopsis sp. PD_33]KAK2805453.1 hypothetical protein FQN51_000279 [Onygenales sp. PD_10]
MSFPGGIHVPSLTFFSDDSRQEIDWDVQNKHFEFLISSGLHGVVIAGTNGEAASLTLNEKTDLVRSARKIAQQLGRADLPIVLGCGAGCTRDVIHQTIQAKEAGANAALVLVPSFFHFAMDQDAIIGFFEELADASPIPIIIYNFPGVTAGLDVNSEALDILGRHKNIVGVKLTCGGIAKVARVAAAFSTSEFSALAGQSDWLIPALSIGGTGCITGVANLFPKTCVELYNLYQSGKLEEAQVLQKKLAVAEWGFAKGGINGTKWVVAKKLGYPETSADCRRPYPKYSSEEKKQWVLNQVSNLDEIEQKL